jgi:shikimate kinase
MGTGKTAIGRLLAQHFNIQLVNTDELIQKKESMVINNIFVEKGEPYFRKVEREVIKEVSKKENIVIDAGGGVVINNDNITDLKKHGIIFCLNTTPEEILKRTKRHAHRPLLNVEDPLEGIKCLLQKRKDCYKKADYQIDTTDKSTNEVFQEIVRIYNKAKV